MDTDADLYSVKAASVNPIDMKVRAGVYDDYAGEYRKMQRYQDGSETLTC